MSSDSNKKYKRPKHNTVATTNPGSTNNCSTDPDLAWTILMFDDFLHYMRGMNDSMKFRRKISGSTTQSGQHAVVIFCRCGSYNFPIEEITWLQIFLPGRPRNRRSGAVKHNAPEPLCPLLAKDSEWVDILQSTSSNQSHPATSVSDEEEVLQLVECEDGPQMRPLAIMFPGLLDKDPQTLQGMLSRSMSTTEVTRHLVDLGQKANFTFMKKADRLIPPEKKWLESVTENSISHCSVTSGVHDSCISTAYDADNETKEESEKSKVKKRKKHLGNNGQSAGSSSSQMLVKKERKHVPKQ